MTEINEMVATLRDVVLRLDDLGIDYMVTGSFAMSDYVTPRMTMDVDIILAISAADAERFQERFRDDYYVDATAIRRAGERQSSLGGVACWVISKEDLILSKLEWAKESHSELQFRDVRNLIETGINDEAIAAGIVNQGLEETWEAFNRWKIQVEK